MDPVDVMCCWFRCSPAHQTPISLIAKDSVAIVASPGKITLLNAKTGAKQGSSGRV